MMAEYVLYCLDGTKLTRCERFACPEDEAAIRESLRRQGTQAAELWSDGRRVRTFAREPVPH